eukprot:NODE_634_length_5185_cov_0.548565.p6 type:complete len:108 gc:universal NODE_634_length_5185_cov_0.548565:3655-3332(-)
MIANCFFFANASQVKIPMHRLATSPATKVCSIKNPFKEQPIPMSKSLKSFVNLIIDPDTTVNERNHCAVIMQNTRLVLVFALGSTYKLTNMTTVVAINESKPAKKPE